MHLPFWLSTALLAPLLVWQGKRIHYGPTEEAFESEDAFVRQFLSGDSAGPLGMD